MSIRGFLQIWLKIFHLQVLQSAALPLPCLCPASALPLRRFSAYLYRVFCPMPMACDARVLAHVCLRPSAYLLLTTCGKRGRWG
jgi:hypothetical protein